MDEDATGPRRTSVRDDQVDDGLSALPASRVDQGDGGTGTQRPLLRSQTRAEHTRRVPPAQPTAGVYSMRGALLDPGLHSHPRPGEFLHGLFSEGGKPWHGASRELAPPTPSASPLLSAGRAHSPWRSG